MSGFARFTVTVEPVARGVSVRIDMGHDDPSFITAPTLEVALRMAVPYMAWAAQPDQLFLGGDDPSARS